MFKEVLADLKISSMSARGSSNKVFGGPDPSSTAEAEPIEDLCIDIWVSVIICLSTQITEMYYPTPAQTSQSQKLVI